MTLLFRYVLALLLAVLLGLPALPLQAQDTVRMGFMSPKREWSRAEVRGTFDLWALELAEKFQIPVTVSHYDDVASMRADFLSGRINAVNSDAMTLVRHFKLEEFAEGYSTHMSGGWGMELFAGKHTPVRDLDDLAGKRLVLLDEDSLSEALLETICLRHYGQPCSAVFAEIQRVPTNNQALMRLFFGKSDLALVYRYGHALATEMNPQLTRSPRSIAAWPYPSTYYAFFSAKVDKSVRERAVRVIPTLHQYPRGRQLLNIFRMDHLEVTNPAILKPFLQLDRDFRTLQANPPRKEKLR